MPIPAGCRMSAHVILNRSISIRVVTLLWLVTCALVTRADIYEWEYIDPLQPEVGKQQSTTLVPDGAGVEAMPGSNLGDKDLSKAYLFNVELGSSQSVGVNLSNSYLYSADFKDADLRSAAFILADLEQANFRGANLDNANLSGSNLTRASFWRGSLRDTDFTDAVVQGAEFRAQSGRNITASQLYSTASYKAGNLAEVSFKEQDLSGWNLQGQNLTQGNLYRTKFIAANLSLAGFEEAYLEFADLSGANLDGANFRNSHLGSAKFFGATLDGAIIEGANLTGASGNGLTIAMLYSTASYQSGSLAAIDFEYNQFDGVDLSNCDLRSSEFHHSSLVGADFSGANLSGADFWTANVTMVNFNGADLSGATLPTTNAAGATFVGAHVQGAVLPIGGPSGMSPAALYSTASYQEGDLTGTYFSGDWSETVFTNQDLKDSRFSNTTLTSSDFSNADLTRGNFYRADFSGANLTGAAVEYMNLSRTTDKGFVFTQLASTASYAQGNLRGIELSENDLSQWDFSEQDLRGTDLQESDLTATIFSGADIRETNLRGTTSLGFTPEQLYSSASYQQGDLSGIDFSKNDLSGWDFSNQKLTETNFSLSDNTDADFSRADLRGTYPGRGNVNFDTAITTNTILKDGAIAGFNLAMNEWMLVRDYHGSTPIAIQVQQEFALDPASTLHFLLADEEWGSTISFDSEIPVSLNSATLNLDFATNVEVTSQVGRTFRLFDWTGVTPVGEFTVSSDYVWNLFNLYSTGEVTLLATLPGDYNNDGTVNLADYTVWRNKLGATGIGLAADGNGDAVVDAADYIVWKSSFGQSAESGITGVQVPEPATWLILGWVLALPSVIRKSRSISW